LGQLILFPRVFGVAASKEGVARSCHVQCIEDYKPDHKGGSIHPADHCRTFITPEAKERKLPRLRQFRPKESAEPAEPWHFLLGQQREGRLLCVVRGKEMVVAAGHHAVRINFVLEGHLVEMSPEHFKAIVDYNDEFHAAKANSTAPLSFLIPEELCVRHTSLKERSLNMLCAFKTSGKVFAFVDHNRLLKLHIMSKPHSWTAADLMPGSQYWNLLWGQDYGPDWVTEVLAAKRTLNDWWSEEALKEKAGKGSTVPFVKVLGDNNLVFNGVGRHLANDLCHRLGVFPSIPLGFLTRDESFLGVRPPSPLFYWLTLLDFTQDDGQLHGNLGFSRVSLPCRGQADRSPSFCLRCQRWFVFYHPLRRRVQEKGGQNSVDLVP